MQANQPAFDGHPSTLAKAPGERKRTSLAVDVPSLCLGGLEDCSPRVPRAPGANITACLVEGISSGPGDSREHRRDVTGVEQSVRREGGARVARVGTGCIISYYSTK